MGRPQFAQQGTRGSGDTVAVTNRPEIQSVNGDATGDLAAGESEIIEIYAPVGSIYTVKDMRVVAPGPGGTTGTHVFRIGTAGGAGYLLYGKASRDKDLEFNYAHWRSADQGEDPSTHAAQVQAMGNLQATENSPIRVLYENGTDATQTGTREITAVVEEVSY